MKTENNLWFKAKHFGWGWYPVSWEGWVLTALYVGALLTEAIRIDAGQHSTSDFLINYAVHFIALTIPFLCICYLKGEKPHWRSYWGRKSGQL